MSFSNEFNTGVYVYSFYIPRINTHHREEDVRYVFQETGIGMVQRVDFAPINPRPGFGANVHNVVRSAFVHFNIIYNTDLANLIIATTDAHQSYGFYISENQYWMLLKAHNPVPTTMMNIHQVVDNCRVLEESVTEKSNSTEKRFEEQATRIAQLEATVATQSDDIKRLQETIYQMLVEIYCQRTQGDQKIDILYGYMTHGKLNNNREYHEDEKSKEESNQILVDNLSVSSHSSMPSLISVTSEEDGETASTHSSDLTWLVDSGLDDCYDYEVQVVEDEEVSSKGSNDSLSTTNSMSQRMRFTAELCDNN